MRYTAGTDSESKLATLLDAAQQEPVFIDRAEQEGAVLVSMRQYERLRGVANREFLKFCDSIGDQASAKGLTETKLEELLSHA